MKKTVKKTAPKKRIVNNKQISLSEDEKYMDEISSNMALYFANNIPTPQLAKWVAYANGYWNNHVN